MTKLGDMVVSDTESCAKDLISHQTENVEQQWKTLLDVLAKVCILYLFFVVCCVYKLLIVPVHACKSWVQFFMSYSMILSTISLCDKPFMNLCIIKYFICMFYFTLYRISIL